MKSVHVYVFLSLCAAAVFGTLTKHFEHWLFVDGFFVSMAGFFLSLIVLLREQYNQGYISSTWAGIMTRRSTRPRTFHVVYWIYTFLMSLGLLAMLFWAVKDLF